jgi:hypothetical protein
MPPERAAFSRFLSFLSFLALQHLWTIQTR